MASRVDGSAATTRRCRSRAQPRGEGAHERGRVARARTEKSQLYTAINRSEVFLVFLSKTFFTRKWCVKEFQEAIATGKHIVPVVDTDPRHGGFSGRNPLEQFVAYSVGQQARAKQDAETQASNLWNQSKLDGDTECEALCQWVCDHVRVRL